jgi:serine/threonine-protein phosphatase 2B catalytic subunit
MLLTAVMIDQVAVTDMLVAVLNCCTKEELDEVEEEPLVPEPGPTANAEDIVERRKVIKNKIMAVGRMARVFALLREESERVSELKSVSGSAKLPYGTLALGAEGIKDAINSFDDAYVALPPHVDRELIDAMKTPI